MLTHPVTEPHPYSPAHEIVFFYIVSDFRVLVRVVNNPRTVSIPSSIT
jgi:hypothetical protein